MRQATLLALAAALPALAAAQSLSGAQAPVPPNYATSFRAFGEDGSAVADLNDPQAAAAVAAGRAANAAGAAAQAPEPPSKPVKVRFSQKRPHNVRRGAIQAQVLADKAAFAALMAKPDAAFDAHLASLGDQRASLLAAGDDIPPYIAVLDGANMAAVRSTFKSALQEIADLNAQSGDTVAYGITPFTHMTKDQFASAYLTGKKDPSATPTAGVDAGVADMGAGTLAVKRGYTCTGPTPWATSGLASNPLLSVVDWRTSKPAAVTPIRNQKSCGSCVVFANTAALEAAYIVKYSSQGATNSTVDLSEQDHMECLAGNSCGGASGYEAVDRAVCKGTAWERDVPYAAKDTNKCSTTVSRPSIGIKGYTFVPADLISFRRALYHNVMSVGVAATNAFQNYKSGVFDCATTAILNHEVAIIAYADAVSVPVNKKTETWKVFTAKNSWGTGWGESGFFRMRGDCPYPGALGIYKDTLNNVPLRA